MRTFAQKQKSTQQASSAKSSMPVRGHLGRGREVNSIFHLQRTTGNQAVQRMLQTHTEELNAGLTGAESPRFGQDFSRIPIYANGPRSIQTKLTVNTPGDIYEQEADRISEQVMRMEAPDIVRTVPPAILRLGNGFQEELAAKHLQRLCTECEGEAFHLKAAPTGAGVSRDQMLRYAEAKVDAVSGGRPLTNEQRAFFEPRFGVDFSRVRIHTDGSADTAARAVGALAFTRDSNIVFRGDQYRPHTFVGRQLLAHELTHVVQQGSAPGNQHRTTHENGEPHVQSNEVRRGLASQVLQCWPGDGMLPPGDCDCATYLVLRGGVETAKAIVSTLGACAAGDNCLTLATKIAAITAEIAARVALDATCFRGGDTGHRQQVQDKINMLNRCYRFFNVSNCPPELIAAMAVVVERAREVVAAAAVAVALGLVVALIVAIVLLVEAIIAALAAAAAAAAGVAVAASAAAVMAVLLLLLEEVSPEGPPTA